MDDKEFIDRINGLVRKSFGLLYRGDYNIIRGNIDGFLDEHNSLLFVAKPTLFGDPALGEGVAGLLGSKEIKSDGSVMVIRNDKKRLERVARRYSQEYENAFGKRAIIIKTDLGDLIQHAGSASVCPKAFGFKSREEY